jgi:hypothetical protein
MVEDRPPLFGTPWHDIPDEVSQQVEFMKLKMGSFPADYRPILWRFIPPRGHFRNFPAIGTVIV